MSGQKPWQTNKMATIWSLLGSVSIKLHYISIFQKGLIISINHNTCTVHGDHINQKITFFLLFFRSGPYLHSLTSFPTIIKGMPEYSISTCPLLSSHNSGFNSLAWTSENGQFKKRISTNYHYIIFFLFHFYWQGTEWKLN